MIRKKDIIIIGIISIILSVTGFIADLNERVPDIQTNVLELLMMTGLLYGIISIIYFPIKLLTHKLGKQ